MSRSLLILPLAAAVLLLSACQSSQDKNDKLAAEAARKQKIAMRGLVIPKADPRIKVISTAILKGTDRNAVVVTVKSTAKTALADVPIALHTYSRSGKETYSNTPYGTDPTLTQIPLIRPGQTFDWIDDQVLGAKPAKASVKIGIGKPVAHPPKDPSLTKQHFFDDPVSGVALKGKTVNNSPFLQKRLVVFSVSRSGGKVIAAGRSVVDKLFPKGQGKPQLFAVYYVGANPRKGSISNFVPSTDLTN